MAVKGYDILISDVNKMLGMERAMIAATNTVMVAQKKRIFENGNDASGSKIGTYSTKKMYMSKSRQAKNTGKTKFEGGYREYKSLTGKESSFVNLWDTGQMRMDLGTTVISRSEYGIGFSNDFNADKAEWNEERFDKEIFITSDEEDELFVKVIEFELDKI